MWPNLSFSGARIYTVSFISLSNGCVSASEVAKESR